MDNQERIRLHIEHESFSLKSYIYTLDLIDNGDHGGTTYHIQPKILIGAISFELIIKLFYLLDKNELHEKTHDIEKLFGKLNSESKKLIEEKFDKTVVKSAKDSEKKMYIPRFKETLSHNKKIVMDFKYDSKLDNGSIVNTAFIKSLLTEIENRIKNNDN